LCRIDLVNNYWRGATRQDSAPALPNLTPAFDLGCRRSFDRLACTARHKFTASRMGTIATIDDAKHRFHFTGAGTTDAARRNTLLSDGPMTIGAGHYFAVVLQRPATAGAVAITYREIEFIMGEAFDVSAELLDNDQGWFVRVSARCSQLIADADSAGALDWEARYSSIEMLQEEFVRRVRRDVPAQRRSLGMADIIAEVAADMPDDWWAHVTGRALVRQDANAAVLWQFRACFAYALCRRDREGEMYAVILDMLGRGVVKEYDECTNGAVAAHVAALMRSTRSPSNLYVFFTASEASSEIARRLADSAAARFAPLFDARWRSAFPALSEAFLNACEGHEARDICSTLAATLALGTDFTKVVADATNMAAKDALQALDTQELRAASNFARMQAIVRFHKPGGSTGVSGGGGGGTADAPRAVETQEQLSSLYGDDHFKAMVRLLEPLITTPLDTTAVGTVLAKAFSPAGLIFMSGKAIPIEPFKKLAAVQSPIVMAAVLNKAVSVNKEGVVRADWGALCDATTAAKLFKGLLAIGQDATHVDYWAFAKRVVAKREGQHVLLTLDTPKKPLDFFAAPELMRRAEAVLVNAFNAIGFIGTGEASYKSYLRWQLAGAEAVATLPDVPAKSGLRLKLLEVAEMAHREVAQRQQLTLRAALDVAARLGSTDNVRFVASGSGTERLVAEFDSLLARVSTDLELGSYNLSVVGANYSQQWQQWPNDRQDGRERGDPWGRAARTNGIYTSASSGQILFWRTENKRGVL